MDLVHWNAELPALRRPVLLVALEGFVDAGVAASTAAMFLRHRWQADVVATLDRDALIDYRARRPQIVVDEGRLRRVEWPDIEVCAATTEGPHDVVLLLGPEPDMRWEAFGAACADLCRTLGVERVIGLGAYPAAAPHTRPVSVVQAGNAAAGELFDAIDPVGGYTGPIGAGTVLQVLLGEVGIPAVGLWAEVPHYVANSPNPPAALRLVELVARVLQVEVDTTELQAAATAHHTQVDEALREHPEAAEMVATLEHHVDSGADSDELPSGEDLAAEIERYLRTEQDG